MDLSFGFLSQLTPREQEILELVANGYEDKAIARRMALYFENTTKPASRAFPGLTGREREILTLMARGWTNEEIVARLVLGVKAVGLTCRIMFLNWK